jgi:hypothetical protein
MRRAVPLVSRGFFLVLRIFGCSHGGIDLGSSNFDPALSQEVLRDEREQISDPINI